MPESKNHLTPNTSSNRSTGLLETSSDTKANNNLSEDNQIFKEKLIKDSSALLSPPSPIFQLMLSTPPFPDDSILDLDLYSLMELEIPIETYTDITETIPEEITETTYEKDAAEFETESVKEAISSIQEAIASLEEETSRPSNLSVSSHISKNKISDTRKERRTQYAPYSLPQKTIQTQPNEIILQLEKELQQEFEFNKVQLEEIQSNETSLEAIELKKLEIEQNRQFEQQLKQSIELQRLEIEQRVQLKKKD